LEQCGIESFTIRYNTRKNVLDTEIRVSEALLLSNTLQQKPTKEFKAIWDTGATTCAITKRIVSELNLNPIKITQVHTAGGNILNKPVYLINIFLPNQITVAYIHAVEVEMIYGGDLLLGMEIINLGDFAVTNRDNKTLLSFQIPSKEYLDFNKPIQFYRNEQNEEL
jgi:predicted aspartyl protease